MMHEEEELQYDISNLQYQVQQISILRRETEDDIGGLKEKMEAMLDGLKDQMKSNMDDKVVEDHILGEATQWCTNVGVLWSAGPTT